MKLMIVGMGDLGGVILDLAALQSEVSRIAVAGRDERRCRERANLARLSAAVHGCFPEVVPMRVDLDDSSSLAEAVLRETPDVVLLTASRASWRLAEQLSSARAERLSAARFGIWLPLHLALAIRFCHRCGWCYFES